MAIVYQVKRSETSSSTPDSSDLAVGELAVNLSDAKIFSKKTDGTIVSFNTSTETPVFFADEVDLGNLTTATNTYDMSSLSGGSPASGGGIALTDLSVTTNSAGTAALSYNNSTGVFTYTPPDLSSYLTDYTVTEADVTQHQAALSITESQISDLQSYLTSETFTSLVQDTTPQLGGTLDVNDNKIVNSSGTSFNGVIVELDSSDNTQAFVIQGDVPGAFSDDRLYTFSDTQFNIYADYGNAGSPTFTVNRANGNTTIAGSLQIGSHRKEGSLSQTIATTSATNVVVYTSADYVGSKLSLTVTDNVTGDTQITEALILTVNGGTPKITTYGTLYTSASALASFDVVNASTDTALEVTMASTNNSTVKVSYTLIDV